MGCCCCVCKKRYSKGGHYSLHTFPRDEDRRKLWESKIPKKGFKATNNTRICSRHFTLDNFDPNKLGGKSWLKKDAVPTLFDFTKNSFEKSHESPVKRKFKTEENSDSHEDLSTANDPEQQSVKKFCYMDNYKENYTSTPIIINIFSERHHKPYTESKCETEENKDADRSFTTENGTERLSAKKNYRYMGDFEENDMHSPTKAVLYFKIASKFRKKKLGQLKVLRDSNRSLRRCVASLKQKLQDMKTKSFVTQAASSGSQLTSPGSTSEVTKEALQQKNISQSTTPSP